jgi:hypothetical protein
MRRSQRLIAAAVLIVFSSVLAGCSSGFSDFDPTDLLDFLDTKKKLPGKREEVFPDGVPGLEQGVPKELYKGAQQQQDDPNAQQALAAPPPQQPQAQPPQAQQPQARQQPLEPPPGSPQAIKRAKAKAKAGAKAKAQAAAEPDGEAAAASQADGTQVAPPPHKKKIVRRRTTAPPPDPNAQPQATAPQSSQPAQAAQEPFPAPLPGGSFSR